MTAIFKSTDAACEVYARYRDVLSRWPVANTQLRLPTREGETFVVACGAQDAPPLVLLHGSQANAATWMFDAAVWSQHFRVHPRPERRDPQLPAPREGRLMLLRCSK